MQSTKLLKELICDQWPKKETVEGVSAPVFSFSPAVCFSFAKYAQF
jgi:hypothetical protein